MTRVLVLIVFLLNSVLPPQALAQGVPGPASAPSAAVDVFMPFPGSRVTFSPHVQPPVLRGVRYRADNPFQLDFILESGEAVSSSAQTVATAGRLVRYFFAALTLPETELWVNLSPYEKGRIIPGPLGLTEMGRDLLSQDYLLKQLTASLYYPNDELGKKFWEDVYGKARAKFGTTDIPFDTFNKVWIVPARAVVREDQGAAFIAESRLKVLLETDYLAQAKADQPQALNAAAASAPAQDIAKEVMREVFVPALEREINEGAHFAPLRQMYSSLILAAWFKQALRDGFLKKQYADHSKVAGIESGEAGMADRVYRLYLEAFRKGAVDLVREETDPLTQEVLPRKYFSGGVDLALGAAQTDLSSRGVLAVIPGAVSPASLRAPRLVRVGLLNAGRLLTVPADAAENAGKLSTKGIEELLGELFTPEARKSLARRIREFHAQKLEEFKPYVDGEDDPTFYTLSIREERAFIEELVADLIEQITENRTRVVEDPQRALELAFRAAAKIYEDIRPGRQAHRPYSADQWDKRSMYITYAIEKKLNIEIRDYVAVFDLKYMESLQVPRPPTVRELRAQRRRIWEMGNERTRADRKVKTLLEWVLRRQRPVLFVREKNSFDTLERAIDGLKYIYGDALDIHGVTGTPFSDRMQLIGSMMPVARPERSPSDEPQSMAFQPGVLTRVAEQARQNPEKTYLLKIDNFEAIPANVRGMLNELVISRRVAVPEVPGMVLELPANVKIIAAVTEGAMIEDSAIYDRFIRKWVPALTDEDLKMRMKHDFNLPDRVVEVIWQTRGEKGADVETAPAALLRLTQMVAGRIRDQPANNDWSNVRLREVINEEGMILSGYRDTPVVSFAAEAGQLLIDGVALPLPVAWLKELDRRLSLPLPPPVGVKARLMAVFRSPAPLALTGVERDQEIRAFLQEKSGLTLTRSVLKVLGVAARSWRYGNRMLILTGPTGVGKTYMAAGIARLFGLPFYSEPIHGESKLSKWLGSFRSGANGDYSLDEQTPFLDILEHGGVAALSELNTAVENDTAKLGWWLVPLARGVKTIVLNEFARPLDATRGRELSRSPANFIFIDINPSSDYQARGELPSPLLDYVPSVNVADDLTSEEIREIATGYLADAPIEKRAHLAAILADYHYRLYEELRSGTRTMARDREHVISLRELRWACDLAWRLPGDIYHQAQEAIETVYVKGFDDPDDQMKARRLSGEAETKSDSKAVENALFVLRAPTLWVAPAARKPREFLETLLKSQVDPPQVRKIACTDQHLNESRLFGGNIIDIEAAARGERRFVFGEGMIPKIIQEAQAARDEDERNGVPAEKQRVFVVWFDNYFNLRPELAVALNAILQERVFYSPVDKRPIKVPDNIRFFASAATESRPLLSAAELGRWVRIYSSADPRTTVEIFDPVKSGWDQKSWLKEMVRLSRNPAVPQDTIVDAVIGMFQEVLRIDTEDGAGRVRNILAAFDKAFTLTILAKFALLPELKEARLDELRQMLIDDVLDMARPWKGENKQLFPVNLKALAVLAQLFCVKAASGKMITPQELAFLLKPISERGKFEAIPYEEYLLSMVLSVQEAMIKNATPADLPGVLALIPLPVADWTYVLKTKVIDKYTSVANAIMERKGIVPPEIGALLNELAASSPGTVLSEQVLLSRITTARLHVGMLEADIDRGRPVTWDEMAALYAELSSQGIDGKHEVFRRFFVLATRIDFARGESLLRTHLSGRVNGRDDKERLAFYMPVWRRYYHDGGIWTFEQMTPKLIESDLYRTQSESPLLTAAAAVYVLLIEERLKAGHGLPAEMLEGFLKEFEAGTLSSFSPRSRLVATILKMSLGSMVRHGQAVPLERIWAAGKNQLVSGFERDDILESIYRARITNGESLPLIVDDILTHAANGQGERHYILSPMIGKLILDDAGRGQECVSGLVDKTIMADHDETRHLLIEILKDVLKALSNAGRAVPWEILRRLAQYLNDSRLSNGPEGRFIAELIMSLPVEDRGRALEEIYAAAEPGGSSLLLAPMHRLAADNEPIGTLTAPVLAMIRAELETQEIEALSHDDLARNIELRLALGFALPEDALSVLSGRLRKMFDPSSWNYRELSRVSFKVIERRLNEGAPVPDEDWRVLIRELPDARDEIGIMALKLANAFASAGRPLPQEIESRMAKAMEVNDETHIKLGIDVRMGMIRAGLRIWKEAGDWMGHVNRLVSLSGQHTQTGVAASRAIRQLLAELPLNTGLPLYGTIVDRLDRDEEHAVEWGLLVRLAEDLKSGYLVSANALIMLTRIFEGRRYYKIRSALVQLLADNHRVVMTPAEVEKMATSGKPTEDLNSALGLMMEVGAILAAREESRRRDTPGALNADRKVAEQRLRPAEDQLLVPVREMLRVERRIVKAWDAGKRVVVLRGDPGGGKTDMLIDVGERFGLAVEVYSAHGFSALEDLIGGYSEDEQGRFILTAEPDAGGHYRIPFLEMLTHGGLFVIDEGAKGERARALISWLSGLAQGDTTLVLNEFPGRVFPPLSVHPDFHIGITTNDPQKTPGSEEIPPEVEAFAEVIDVPNRLSVHSYQVIVERFYEREFKGAALPATLKQDILLQVKAHLAMVEASEQLLDSNGDWHTVTLREFKSWVKAVRYYQARGKSFQEALGAGFRLVYLDQFSEEDRRNVELYLRNKRAGQWAEPMKTEPEMSSERQVCSRLADALAIGAHGFLKLNPGAREKEILDRFAAEQGYEQVDLESTPEMTTLQLIGGAFPVFPGEDGYGRRNIQVKPGFLTRHLVPEGGLVDPSTPRKLLVIHNIDALPERVRAALNNFLLKGYIIQRASNGGSVKLVLPSNVRIVATMAALSQREFSSAFFNRFIKINVDPLKAAETGRSELLMEIESQYSLSEREARKIEQLSFLIKAMETGNFIWPSHRVYLFSSKEALLHARFVALALAEAQARKEELTSERRQQIIIEEAVRVYGASLKEEEQDYAVFIEVLLTKLFRDVDAQSWVPQVVRGADGRIVSLAGVPVAAAGQTTLAPRTRLTLVPQIVETLATILRGWQAGKIVSLTGETAGAKTAMGKYLAASLGCELYLYSTHGQSKASNLTAEVELATDGRYRLALREFVERIKRGGQVIIIDEVNLRPEIVWVLSGIARGERDFTIEIPGQESLKFHIADDVYFLLTKNPGHYAGRADLPEVFSENVLRVWAPTGYEDRSLEIILDGMLSSEQETALASLEAAQNRLSEEGLSRSVEEFLALINEKGHKKAVADAKRAGDLKDLEARILARPDVQRKINAIRAQVQVSTAHLAGLTKGAFPAKVRVVFDLEHWWSMSGDGTTIFVPLYELVKKGRSKEAVLGLIIHELRHKMWDLTKEEKSKARLKKPYERRWHQLWNILADLKNDLGFAEAGEGTMIEGEQRFIDAMNKEFFFGDLKVLSPEDWENTTKNAPDKVFMNMLLTSGYSQYYHWHGHSDYFRLPEEIKAALDKVIGGGNESLLVRTTRGAGVVADIKAIQDGRKDFVEERQRAAVFQLDMMIAEICPILDELRAKGSEADQENRQPGKDGGMEGPSGEEAPEAGTGPGVPEFTFVPESAVPGMIQGLTPIQVASPGVDQPGKEAKPAGSSSPTTGTEALTSEERKKEEQAFQDALNDARDQRGRQIADSEPLNALLIEMGPHGRRLARGLIELLKTPELPDWEYSATGVLIDPVRYLLRDREPFLEEVLKKGASDIALGVTLDGSGSMGEYRAAMKKLLAILMTSFSEVGRRKGEYSVNIVRTDFETRAETSVRFKENIKGSLMNGRFAAIARAIDDGGGGIHLENALSGIIEKYKDVKKKHKIEFLVTDGEDVSRNLTKMENERPIPSARIRSLLDQARKSGITIVGIGFNTRDTEIFDHFIQLNKENAESVVEIVLKLARRKAVGLPLPAGDMARALSGALHRAVVADHGQSSREAVSKGAANMISASTPAPGGIDLTRAQLPLQVVSNERPLQIVEPDMAEEMLCNGLVPVILGIEPWRKTSAR